ncbi:MAG: ABC transporter ATP-binding protein [Legionellaceae bacterium]|nr:ABC transporter ATP-binding protein [Legionellaceae bacterium]
MNKTTLKVLLNIWQHISKRRRGQFILLLCLTFVSALTEVLSLSSTIPFIGVITEPDKVYALPIMAYVIQGLKINSAQDLIVPLSVGFGLAALLAGALRLTLIWMSTWLGNATGTDFGVSIYHKTLYQPYHVHISRSSSEVISGITQKVSMATGVIISVVTFITTIALFITIMSVLLIVDPMLSLIAVFVFGGSYVLIAKSTRARLMRNGHILALQQTLVMKSLREGLGAIRDVLLDGVQNEYASTYRQAALKQQRANSQNSFLSQAPRYLMETLGMLLIAFFVLIASYRPSGLVGILPKLGLLALGAQRLLPLMQQIYGSWSTIMGNRGGVIDVIELLDQPLSNEGCASMPSPLQFNRDIKFKNLSFQYTNTSPFVLKHVSLSIPKGARVGIVGDTGCGKSTMFDILMGLLEPTRGEFLIDDVVINRVNKRSWQRIIAHVPQTIFLTDSTIAENIAFGVPVNKINHQRVREAAERAHAHKFIENSAEGYNTFVGERGIRLSGGQRQRIGIARAFYKQASVLFFDEATSALDNNTENDVMSAIDYLDENVTILIVAHRLTTLKKCTHFVKLEEARIKHIDSYVDVQLEEVE